MNILTRSAGTSCLKGKMLLFLFLHHAAHVVGVYGAHHLKQGSQNDVAGVIVVLL